MSDRGDSATAPNDDPVDREPSDRDAPLEELAERITDDRRNVSSEGDDSVSEGDNGASEDDDSGSDIAGNDVASDNEATGRRSTEESTEPMGPPRSSVGQEGTPLERIVGDVRERRHRREREESDPFEEMDVGAVDGEDVWKDLLSEEDVRESERAVGAGASAAEVETTGLEDRTEHIVPKAPFCGRCPYLSQPPGLACENGGTEIVEVTDSEHFRVRNCPFTERDESDLSEFD